MTDRNAVTELKPLSPSDLADALESGKYTRKTGQLSAGPNSKQNCCLGVAAREAGFDFAAGGTRRHPAHELTDLIELQAEAVLPWLDAIGTELAHNLMEINDQHEHFGWRRHTIPLLRALKINKDGSLSKRQDPDVQWFIDDMIVEGQTLGEAKERLARIRAKQKAGA